jgi:hypothetical protein
VRQPVSWNKHKNKSRTQLKADNELLQAAGRKQAGYTLTFFAAFFEKKAAERNHTKSKVRAQGEVERVEE